jgi:nucleolin
LCPPHFTRNENEPSAKRAKTAPVSASKAQPVEEDSSSESSSDSDSDSSSEDEAPAKPAAKPASSVKAPVASVSKVTKKDDSSDSDSSSSDDSSSEDEKPAAKSKPVAAVPAKAAAPAKAAVTPAKKVSSDDESSSSSSESESSDSEDEKPKAKPTPVVSASKKAAVTPAKKDDTSSSSDSDSDSSSSDDEDEEEKPVSKKQQAASTPASNKKKESNDYATPAATTPSSSGNGGETYKIYVKGLPWQATEDEVREFFKDCGTITSCETPLDENGRSSGTAYVKFSSRSGIDAALALDGQTWPDTTRWLKIVESSDKQDRKSFSGGPTGEKPEGCDTVFVGNLPWEVDEDQMRELFSEAGEVSTVRFATGEDGSFRGFGHVQFFNGDDVTKAVKLAGKQLGGRAIRVDYAPPRAPRQSFGDAAGGARSPGGRGGGRGGFDGGRGGRGRGGGRGGGRGFDNGAPTPGKRNIGVAVTGSGKKTTFDE